MRRIPVCLGLALLALPVRAQAQWTVQLHEAADTAIGLVPATATLVPVYADPNGLSFNRARLTFRFDPALVTVEAATFQTYVGLWHTVDTTRGPGFFSVGATASFFLGGFDPMRLFALRVRLAAGATQGTYIHAEVDSLNTQFSGNQPGQGGSHIGQVCRANQMYGDVDESGEVDSRDALITLSAAIGLPAAGFNLALGDVDRDAVANSRDALMMLAYSIGIGITAPHRTGAGVPAACPPLTPLGDRIVFVRRGTTQDSLFTLAPGSVVPDYVPGTADNSGDIRNPRLSTGSVALYTCLQPTNYFACRVNMDGSAFTIMLTGVLSSLDWSPGDSLILFESGGALFTSDPGGTGIIQRTGALPLITSPGTGYAWNRDGTTIAYPVNSSAARIIGRDGQNDVAVTSANITRSDFVRWSPAGDSLALGAGNRTGFWILSPAGGPARRVSSFRFHTGPFAAFDWGADGLLFAHDQPDLRGLWLMPAGGGVPRRITNGNDHQPAFRRNP